jgi:transcriptional regulator with XRE-family HTH domain
MSDIAAHVLNRRIARRLKERRQERGLTLEALASVADVSRAMISKIEREEVSPTAALLGRLANALGITLSDLFASPDRSPLLTRADERPVWTDPASGYRRRSVSPQAAPLDIVDVTLPAGAKVDYPNTVPLRIAQVVWVITGSLTLSVDSRETVLAEGDSMLMRLDQPISYENRSDEPVRYAVVLATGGTHG